MSAYAYKVVYNVKHIDKKSALYGLVSFDQTCKFGSLKEAFRFAHEMKNKRTSKIQVVGLPIVERL
jgi:folate-dependent tRNA-U54 methylase TrmFO/GidA